MNRRLPILSTIYAVLGLACGDNHKGPATDAGVDAYIPPALASFPEGFLFGSAMAPYQVEGGLTNTDWYQWEGICEHCSGDSAENGPEFWTRYETDFDNAKSISNNAVRIGIEWARVFPTAESFPDSPDQDAVEGYHDILAAARTRGLEPMVTLQHFSLPIWVQDLTDQTNKSGWEDPAMIDRFAQYAAWAAGEFGTEVDLWITINEPFVNITGGWISGDVPPGKSFEIDLALDVGLNMVRAHARAYDAIHANDMGDADGDAKAARVSISKHNRVFLPRDPEDERHVAATRMLEHLLNHYFLEAVVRGNIDMNFDYDLDDAEDIVDDETLKGRLDYLGLNYYGVTLIIDTANDNNFPLIGIPLINDLDNQGFDAPISDFGWSIYAAGLREVLDQVAPYGLPIIITENGIADAGETMRARFIIEHLYEVQKAIQEGIPVEGYFHWSLIDNFEWASGYCPRFGLFRVDFDNPDKPRTLGEGASVYKRIIDANDVTPSLFGEYEYGVPGLCPRIGL